MSRDDGGTGGGAYDEPFRVALETTPERPTLCCDDGGVALAGHCLEFRGVVGVILFRRDELRLACAAVLHVIVEGLQVDGGNFGTGWRRRGSGGLSRCGRALGVGWNIAGGRACTLIRRTKLSLGGGRRRGCRGERADGLNRGRRRRWHDFPSNGVGGACAATCRIRYDLTRRSCRCCGSGGGPLNRVGRAGGRYRRLTRAG